MQIRSPVTDALDELGVDYTLHLHENQVRSLEQAARERGLEPEQIVRSLLFRCEGDEYIMVLMSGPLKVNWTKLRRHLCISRITTATADQVLEITGYVLGAVSPFGTPSPVKILADRTILEHKIISLGAGVRNAGVILKREDFLDAVEVEIGDFGG